MAAHRAMPHGQPRLSGRAPALARAARAAIVWRVAACLAPAALRAQVPPPPLPQQAESIRYESLAAGLVGARVFTSDALRDVTVEVKDFMLGPGASTSDLHIRGIAILELKAGEVETTIAAQPMRRRPGDYWVLRAGQPYTIKSLGGHVVLAAFLLTKRP